MADVSVRELGQFLAGPGAMFNAPSTSLFLGLGVLSLTLTLVVVLVLRPLVKDVRSTHILAIMPFVALGSTLLVLFLQWGAEWLRYMIHDKPLNAAKSVAHGSGKQVIGGFLFLIVAYIIGWGYSRSLEPDTFAQHILSFTLGTGVVEEVVKGVAGLAFLSALCDVDPRKAPRRLMLVAFTAAGLSFGAGEALFYFQVYAGLGSEPGTYVLRATWCVLLHGAWSFLTGLLFLFVARWLDRAHEGVVAALFIACCLPAALLHGLYDAACLHSSTAVWTLGALCLGPWFCGMLQLRWSAEPEKLGCPLPSATTVVKGPLLQRLLLREHAPYAMGLLSQGAMPEAVLQKLVERGLTHEEARHLMGEVLTKHLMAQGLGQETASTIVRSFQTRNGSVET